MKATDVIREVMRLKEVKPSTLAAKLNIKNNVLSERLGQKNISISKMQEMLSVMDYKILAVPKDSTVSSEEFEID